MSEEEENMLSTERVVATFVMAILTAVGLWAGGSLTKLSSSVAKLQVQMDSASGVISDLRADSVEIRQGQTMIGIIVERMKADDDRERRDAGHFEKIDQRLDALERGR